MGLLWSHGSARGDHRDGVGVAAAVWEGPLCLQTLLEFATNSTIEPADPRAGSPQDKKLRVGVQPHQSADNWIKALLSKGLPTRARCIFSHPSGPSHQEVYISLLATYLRGWTEEARRATIPQ